ncbi:Uncharacterised protein [Bordetella pertussis]|nr:Uncharacterised protein [Bordetella pertussis]CFW29898.1 Uncharacterised protein [Bordetella pertussis]CPO31776.1 Uncharacterised protein [Bordetella pertussis]
MCADTIVRFPSQVNIILKNACQYCNKEQLPCHDAYFLRKYLRLGNVLIRCAHDPRPACGGYSSTGKPSRSSAAP